MKEAALPKPPSGGVSRDGLAIASRPVSAKHARGPGGGAGLRRWLDAVARNAWRAWDGAYVAWNGAFALATGLGTACSLIVFGFIIRKDSALVLLGPLLSWVALGWFIRRGKALHKQDQAHPPIRSEYGSPRWKPLLLLLTSLGFVAVGVFLGDGDTEAWLGEVFFGVCSVAFAIQLVATTRLRVLPEGFEVTALGRRLPLYRWEDCDDFTVWGGPTDVVLFNYTGPKHRWRLGMPIKGAWRSQNRNAALPSTFGLSGPELVNVLVAGKANAPSQ